MDGMGIANGAGLLAITALDRLRARDQAQHVPVSTRIPMRSQLVQSENSIIFHQVAANRTSLTDVGTSFSSFVSLESWTHHPRHRMMHLGSESNMNRSTPDREDTSAILPTITRDTAVLGLAFLFV